MRKAILDIGYSSFTSKTARQSKGFVMKRWSMIIAASLACLILWRPAVRGAETGEEQQLIEVLKSTATLAEKDAACARLKFIGTRQCVPTLAVLLADEQLSHSARYALEAMAFDQAGVALLDSLSKTKRLLSIGIINSLAAREEARALPALAQLLGDPDPAT